VVLVDAGMLLEPVQRWTRLQVPDLDGRWWWKPLWGCYKCNAGWWGAIGVPVRSFLLHAPYSPWEHLVVVALTIYLSIALNKIYQLCNG
jgi:hypothetical protein